MAKKKTVKKSDTPPLDEEWIEKIPEEVEAAVDVYVKSLRAKNKASEKVRNSKELCIEAMVKHGIGRVSIDEGAKWLVLEDAHKLKTEKAKTETDE